MTKPRFRVPLQAIFVRRRPPDRSEISSKPAIFRSVCFLSLLFRKLELGLKTWLEPDHFYSLCVSQRKKKAVEKRRCVPFAAVKVG